MVGEGNLYIFYCWHCLSMLQTGEEITTLYYSYLRKLMLNGSQQGAQHHSKIFGVCYDAVWTLARALNNTLNGKKVTLTATLYTSPFLCFRYEQR